MTKKQSKSKSTKKLPALPSTWQLLSKSWFELATFWRPILGVTAVYATLYLLFVLGFSFVSTLKVQPIDGSTILNAFNTIFGSISNTYSGSQSDATVLLQYLLFMTASLAIIWLLRKLQALKK